MLHEGDVERAAHLDRADRLLGSRRAGAGAPLLDLQGEDALLDRVRGDDQHAHRLEGQHGGARHAG